MVKVQISTHKGMIAVNGDPVIINAAANHKFAVVCYNNRWRVTELSTGVAIPGSYSTSKTDSIKGAEIAISKRNEKGTYFDGLVAGAHWMRLQLEWARKG